MISIKVDFMDIFLSHKITELPAIEECTQTSQMPYGSSSLCSATILFTSPVTLTEPDKSQVNQKCLRQIHTHTHTHTHRDTERERERIIPVRLWYDQKHLQS